MTIYFSSKKNLLEPLLISSTDAKTYSLMDLLRKAQIPVASSCQGDGICGKCQVQVLQGSLNLNPETELEIKTKERNQIKKSHRLSCQTFINGDITIDTDYW